MSVQIIKQGDKPEWAVIPYTTYVQLVEKADLLQDIQDYDKIKSAIAQGEEELIPSEVIYAILDGENPIRVWREYRGKSQQQTAAQAGISVPYLSQLETGKRTGSLAVLTRLAGALSISIEEIHTHQG